MAQTTPGLESNPTFTRTNSPVSPVDRKRLLTAPSNTLPQFDKLTNAALGWQQRHYSASGRPRGQICANQSGSLETSTTIFVR